MAEKASNVVLNFKMDGQVKYAETLKQINQVMNTAAKEYKNHIAAMGNDASATDKLRAEKKKLEIQMDGAQKRTKMLRAEYEAMGKDTNATTDQLTAMYGKLLDSERAETSLQKSLERVNAGLSDQAQDAREAKDRLDGLKSEAKLLDAEQKNLTSSFKLQTAELGKNATETEKAELAQKQFDAQMGLTERAVQNLEQQLNETKTAYGENSVEVMQLETKLNEAKTTVKQFSDSLENIESGGDSAADGMENLGKKIDANTLMEGAEALQAVSDKLIEIGKASFDSALSWGDSQTQLQANLGLTAEEAEALNGVVQDVFKNGVVGSVEEATNALIVVKSAFGDLNDTDLENLTNQITTISKRTGTDVLENTNALEKVMETYGITATEALDLIAAGYQNNLNKSGDYLDTLTEYTPLFKDAGYSAEEMFAVMTTTMEAGARSTDLVQDAVKELQVKLGDDTQVEAFKESFSDATDTVIDKWKNNEATVQDVANSIAEDMKKMSPSEQQAALTVLGSQYEDLGINASLSLLGVTEGLNDVAGAAEAASTKNPTEEFQSGIRSLQEQLLPLGEKLVEIAQDVLPKVIDAISTLSEWFSNLSGPVQTYIETFGGISAVLVVLSPVIAAIVAGFMAFGSTLAIVIGAVIAVTGIISGIMAVFQNWGTITDWLSEKFNIFATWISELFANMGAAIAAKFQEIRDAIVSKVTELVESASNTFTNFSNSVSNVFSSISSTASNIWNNITSTISSAVNGISSTVSGVFNGIKSTVDGVWNGIKSTISNAINGAKTAVSSAISAIKSVMNFSWSLPKLKMPHFSVSGSFSLNPPSVPKLAIDWYKNGGIFSEPTIFQAANGRVRGFGDGPEPEAALPLNAETLGAIGKGIAATMTGAGVTVVSPVYLDGKEIARVTTKHVDRNMQSNSRDLSFGTGRK